jgi:transcription elongation factor Elf1
MKLAHLLILVVLINVLTVLLDAVDSLDFTCHGCDRRSISGMADRKILRVPPLMFLSGPCPRCGHRPSGWWSDDRHREVLRLLCGACGKRVDLWLTNSAPADAHSTDVPAYVLRQPRFFGIWRRS